MKKQVLLFLFGLYSLFVTAQCANPVGDPSVYPLNAWTCYIYNANTDLANYLGYMDSFPGLSFHTNPNHALANSASFSPASGPGLNLTYHGCTVSGNYVLRYVRQGVPECGSYHISALQQQEIMKLRINGVLVWQNTDYLTSDVTAMNLMAWSGYLDGNTIIEYEVFKDASSLSAGLEFVKVEEPSALASACDSSITVNEAAMGFENVKVEDFTNSTTLAYNGFTLSGNASMQNGTMALTSGGGQTGTVSVIPSISITDFVINYDQKIPNATLANGVSFNFGNFNPASGGGEIGFTSGLAVCFRTAPSPDVIEVKWNGVIIGSANQDIGNGEWKEITISVTKDGAFSLQYGASQTFLFNELFISGYATTWKTGWKMAFSGKTANLSNNTQSIDDVNLFVRNHAEYAITSSPNPVWQTSNFFDNLAYGTYEVSVRHSDHTSCIKSQTVEVGALYYLDSDLDGYGNPNISTLCPQDGWVSNNLDCNDVQALVNIAMPEICNSIDDNCDGAINEGLPIYYIDMDNDGFGVNNPLTNSCVLSSTHSFYNTDCNDFTSSMSPAVSEICNSIDDDCDGIIDNNLAVNFQVVVQTDSSCFNQAISFTATNYGNSTGYTWKYNGTIIPGTTDNTLWWGPMNDPSSLYPSWNAGDEITCTYTTMCNAEISTTQSGPVSPALLPTQLYYRDTDNDGFGNPNVYIMACSPPISSSAYVLNNQDCNDGTTLISPSVLESCNQIDDNCNGLIDDGLVLNNYYVDADNDNFGSQIAQQFCEMPDDGFSINSLDCDDSNGGVKPGAIESCNTVDENCNGLINDGLVMYSFFEDLDGDQYGVSSSSIQWCSNGLPGYAFNDGDCNDNNNLIHPDNFDPCDGIDNNCDGITDDQGTNLYYTDADNDGYGNQFASIYACTLPLGYATVSGDCNDSNANINPLAAEICNSVDDNCNYDEDENLPLSQYFLDVDNDGYGKSSVYVYSCMQFAGYSSVGGDCADNNALSNPGMVEVVCNGIDDNCDFEDSQSVYYLDNDGDGFGNNFVFEVGCAQPVGYVNNNLDCVDYGGGAANINPNATEICSNGVDDNCDGTQNNSPASDFYLDADGDGFGGEFSLWTCTPPPGYTSVQGDCNDTDNLVFPNASEICNGLDENCNSQIDEGVLNVYYQDIDSDGFGDQWNWTWSCIAPIGYILDPGDCEIYDPTINPGVTEVCNEMDDNCDGNADEGIVMISYYEDNDGDGFGDPWSEEIACESPDEDWVTLGGDCNDESWFGGDQVYPGAVEICDDWDNNCNGLVDEGFSMFLIFYDADNDGYGNGTSSQNSCELYSGYSLVGNDCNDQSPSVYPQATEICGNTIDDNCDNVIDENCAVSALTSSVPLLNIGNYGTGAQSNSIVLFAGASNTIENPGDGIEVWYNFVASANAIRISLTGSNIVGDDNDLSIFNSPQNPGVPLIPLALENDVNPSALGISLDGGNEILYYDGLVPGQTYYICVRNLNFIFNTCSINISYLRGSQNDILPYTNYTGIYTDACQNFKAKFRTGATGYIVDRFSSLSNYYSGNTPDWTYALPQASGTTTASTVCQIGKILPANLSAQTVSYYTRVNVLYTLKDAFGNSTPVVANGITPELVQLSPESALAVRNSDQCPIYKKVSGSIATNRAVCGSLYYSWQIAETLPNPGIPAIVNGPQNASRILALASFPGMGSGKTFDVAIGNVHFDGYSASNYGPVGCVRTIGAAGMQPTNNETSLTMASNSDFMIYPNPSAGENIYISITNPSSWVNLKVADASGRVVSTMSWNAEDMPVRNLNVPSDLANGMYMVTLSQFGKSSTVRMMIAN